MHKINEVEKFIEKYNNTSSKAICPKNSEFDYDNLLDKFSNAKLSDCPDMYYVDWKENKIFIFEHFEIDNCKHTRKGSALQIEQNKDINKYKEYLKKIKDIPENNYNSFFKVDSTIENYYDCLIKSFYKHIKSIKNYKEEILENENLKENDWDFFITFVIEDKSLFGCVYNDCKILLPIFVKEFMDVFRTQTEVNCLFCSNFINNEMSIWLLAKKDENKFLNSEKEIKSIKVVNFNNIYSIG